MFRNYIKSAVRNLAKHKLYAGINIFSLALGLALCVLVVSHVAYELSFDKFHHNLDRTFRVRTEYSSEDIERRSALAMAPLAPAMVDELPEVEKAVVLRRYQSARYKIDDMSYKAGHLNITGPEFLSVFTFPLKAGDPETALVEPLSVVISDSIAQAHFEGLSPLGQRITINDRFDCRVTGVLKPIPYNTQLRCDFIVSYASLDAAIDDTESWENIENDFVFLLLHPDADYRQVEAKIPNILASHLPPETAGNYRMDVQPFSDIYFSSYYDGFAGDFFPAGETSLIYMFIAIAVFILIQAIANFINLSTARASYRVKEVGVRKTVGAFRRDLIWQFLGESIIIASISLLISLPLYELAKPWFNAAMERPALIAIYNNSPMIIALVALVLAVGILAGFYPALYLSRFRPIAILQGNMSTKSSKSILRKGLVTFQFIIAIVFISGTVIIDRQIDFVTKVDLGFDRSDLLVLDFGGEQAADNCQRMKNALSGRSCVASLTASDCPLGRRTYHAWGMYKAEEKRDEDYVVVKAFFADRDYVSTFNLKLLEGTDLSGEMASEIRIPVLINKSGAEALGIEHPMGHKLYARSERFYEIVGMLDDYHSSTDAWAEREISLVALDPQRSSTLTVKLSSDDYTRALSDIASVWGTILPGEPFDYTFLDDEIDQTYGEYRRQGGIFFVLAIAAIAIACTGIFGLVSYTAEQKTKEIGVRKILGASVADVIQLLSREFVILIAIANVIAWPVAYLFMNGFLSCFIYRADFGIGTFLLIGLFAVMLALASAGIQAVKAATANPVDSLRHE